MATKEGYNIVKEGYLLKQSLHFKQLRNRWIVLNMGYIDCYKNNASHDVTESFNLSSYRDVRISIEGKPGQFELVPNKPRRGKPRKPNRVFVASSTKDMNDWINKIKYCMGKNNKHNTHESKTCTNPNQNIIINKSASMQSSPKQSKSTKCLGSYTQKDIKEVSTWYSKELQNIRDQYDKEHKESLQQIEELNTALNEMKHKHSKRTEVKTLSPMCFSVALLLLSTYRWYLKLCRSQIQPL